MTQKLYDPTGEIRPVERARVSPLSDLEDKKIMLFDIGKPRSNEFLDYLDVILNKKGLTTVRAAKPTNAKTAPKNVMAYMVKEADVVIEALAG